MDSPDEPRSTPATGASELDSSKQLLLNLLEQLQNVPGDMEEDDELQATLKELGAAKERLQNAQTDARMAARTLDSLSEPEQIVAIANIQAGIDKQLRTVEEQLSKT